ncbi:MAG: O-antigen ligase family protein [Xanthomarina sp.]
MLLDKRSIIFLIYVFVFALDSVLNYFYSIPLFVLSLISLFFLFLIPGFFSIKKYSSFLIVVIFFSVSLLLNILRSGFYKESLSDYLFIMSFFGAFYFYAYTTKSNSQASTKKLINLFLVISLILFLSTYIGFDQNLWGNTLGLKSNDIEYNRSYRQGFFRKAHIASYFFTFILLYFLNKYKTFGASIFVYILTVLPLVTIILLTGSRTPIIVISLGLIIYFFKAKFLKFLIPLATFGVLLIVYIDKVLVLFNNTIIYQYLTVIKTTFTNFSRLSRVIIWSSWWKEMKTFNIIDIFFGRGFNASIEANLRNTANSIWFHNDFLSITYSYGILPLILYIIIFINIYKRHKGIIKGNVFIFLAFSSFWLSAFFNGFYYYYPILLLYLFYVMIYEKNEDNYIRD